MSFVLPIASGVPSIVSYNNLQQNDAKYQSEFDNSPDVQREVAYFKSAINKVTSVNDIFKDQRLVNFLAKSVNLDSDAQYPGKLRQILTQDNSDPNAIMNKLSDKRYAQAASVLRLGDLGLSRVQMLSTQDTLVSNYESAAYDQAIGDQNPAIRKARYFAKYASTATSVWNVLSDPIIRDVVTSTFGIPKTIAIQPIDSQAAVINSHLDISKLQDPKFVNDFIKKYLNTSDMNGSSTGSGAANTSPNAWQLGLFGGSSSSSGGSWVLNLFA